MRNVFNAIKNQYSDIDGVGGPQLNKFKQVSSDNHEMSLAGGPGLGVRCLMPREKWGWGWSLVS